MISPASALAGENESFDVSLKTHEQVGFKLNCPSQFGGTTTGKGESTQLGRVSFEATDCITPMEDHFTSEGEFAIITTNGDKVTGNYGGSFVPIGTGPTYRLSDGTFEITGGTGGFAQATGSGELQGKQDTTTGDGTLKADGTISY